MLCFGERDIFLHMLACVSEPGNLVLDVIEQFGEQAVGAGCGKEEPSFIRDDMSTSGWASFLV